MENPDEESLDQMVDCKLSAGGKEYISQKQVFAKEEERMRHVICNARYKVNGQ